MPIIEADGLTKTYRVFQKKEGVLGALRGLYRREYKEVRAVDPANQRAARILVQVAQRQIGPAGERAAAWAGPGSGSPGPGRGSLHRVRPAAGRGQRDGRGNAPVRRAGDRWRR